MDVDEDYRSIDSMTPALVAFAKEVAEKCGWAVSLFIGGPLPVAGGAIQIARYLSVSFLLFCTNYLSLHIGETEHGNTFEHSHPEYKKVYLEPFTNFVRKVFREFNLVHLIWMTD